MALYLKFSPEPFGFTQKIDPVLFPKSAVA
jgi:hypothetical protein